MSIKSVREHSLPRERNVRRGTALLAVTCIALFSGCSAGSQQDEPDGSSEDPVELTFFTIPVNNTPVIEALIEEFETAHPNITVNLELGPNNVDTVRGLLATQITSGSSTPDVYEGDVMWPAQFADEGLAVNLSE